MTTGRSRLSVPPFKRLGPGKRGRFGRQAPGADLKWLPWSPEETWEVALSYVQHLLAVAMNDVIEGRRPAADGATLGDNPSERLAALTEHCGMTLYGMKTKLAGRRALSAAELWAWVAIVGIDNLPAAVTDLLPPSDSVLPKSK